MSDTERFTPPAHTEPESGIVQSGHTFRPLRSPEEYFNHFRTLAAEQKASQAAPRNFDGYRIVDPNRILPSWLIAAAGIGATALVLTGAAVHFNGKSEEHAAGIAQPDKLSTDEEPFYTRDAASSTAEIEKHAAGNLVDVFPYGNEPFLPPEDRDTDVQPVNESRQPLGNRDRQATICDDVEPSDLYGQYRYSPYFQQQHFQGLEPWMNGMNYLLSAECVSFQIFYENKHAQDETTGTRTPLSPLPTDAQSSSQQEDTGRKIITSYDLIGNTSRIARIYAEEHENFRLGEGRDPRDSRTAHSLIAEAIYPSLSSPLVFFQYAQPLKPSEIRSRNEGARLLGSEFMNPRPPLKGEVDLYCRQLIFNQQPAPYDQAEYEKCL